MSQPKRQTREAEAPESARKMAKVSTLEQCVKTAGSYWIKQFDNPRWNLMISNFGNTLKVRITTIVPGRGIVTLVNLNANRLDRALEILGKLKEKLNALEIETDFEEEDDW